MIAVPERVELSVRSPGWTRGGPLARRLRAPSARTLSGRTRALLLVHGYNNDETDARDAYGVLLRGLPPSVLSAFDCVVEFQWPGDSYLRKAVGAAMYPQQIETARAAARLLAAELVRAAGASGGRLRVSVVAHSLGCRLILEAIADGVFRAGSAPRLDLVLLMAAAVPVNLVRSGHLGAKLATGGTRPSKIVILHSRADRVLRWAFPVGQGIAWNLRIETAWHREAVGRWGEPFRAGTDVTPFPTGYGHSDYWSGRTTAWMLANRIGGTASAPLRAERLPAHAPMPENAILGHGLHAHRLGGM